jgi:HEAT repeat protein
VGALSDTDKFVRSSAVIAVHQLAPDHPALKDASREFFEDLWSDNGRWRNRAESVVGELRVVAAVPRLLEMLKDPNEYIRSRGAWALGRIGDPRAVSSLIGLLNDPSFDAPIRAVEALGSLKAREATSHLTTVLFSGSSKRLRYEAALALGEIGDPSAIPALENAISDPERAIRSAAEYALIQVRGEVPKRQPLPLVGKP